MPGKTKQVRTYSSIPRVLKWKLDSAVSKARRRDDRVLRSIDGLVWAHNKSWTKAAKNYLVGELYFATDWWLRHYKGSSPMVNEREPAIRALFACAAMKLCRCFGCTVNVLPARLQQYYGRVMTSHGLKVDLAKGGSAEYLSRAEAEQYRLIFWEDGKFRQFPWWGQGNGPTREPELAQSAVACEHSGTEISELIPVITDTKLSGWQKDDQKKWKKKNKGRKGVHEKGRWGFFAMGINRDLYMGPHKDDFYHSAYLAGQPVLCSGTIWVVDGVVQGIRNDSGHYQPTDRHLVSLLKHLHTLGFDPAEIRVYPYVVGGDEAERALAFVWGDDFLKEHGNWKSVLKRGEEEDISDRATQGMMAGIRRKSEQLRQKKTSLRELVQAQFEKFKADKNQYGGKNPDTVWRIAYKTVCSELAMVDAAWKQEINKTPIPRVAVRKPAPTTTRPSKGQDQRMKVEKIQKIREKWERFGGN